MYEVDVARGSKGIGTKGVPRPHREAQILRAATDHFAEHGFARSAMADIARRAGISKPLIYQYFGSKERLYGLCLEAVSDAVMAKVEAVTNDVPPTLDGALETLRSIFDVLEQNPRHWRLIHDTTLPEGALRTAAWRHRSRTAVLASMGVEGFLRNRGNDDELDASALTSVWMGVIHSLVLWWIDHPDQTSEQMSQRAVRLFLALLAETSVPG